MPSAASCLVLLCVFLGACSEAYADEADALSATAEAAKAPPEPASRRLTRSGPRSLYCESPTLCCPGPPVFGYDEGFFVRDRRARFTLKPSAFTQLRWTRNERSSVPPGEGTRVTNDTEFARTRVRFEGDLTRRFYYDVRLNITSDGDVSLLVAYLQWNVNKQWTVQYGTLPLADQREDWARPIDLLTTEYSANDLIFAPGFTGFGSGLQVHWQGTCQRAWGAISDGEFFGGNHFVEATGSADWALTGRYEHQFFTRDWSVWDDLVGRKGREFGILAGFMGGVTRGGTSADVDTRYLMSADLSANWDGGQALVFGNVQRTKQKDGTTDTIWGFAAQAGHFVTRTLQPYARYEIVSPGSTAGDLNTYQTLTLGLNHYPFRWTNLYKLSAEFSYLFTPLNRTVVPGGSGLGFLASDEDQFYVRVQLQFGL